MLRVDEVERPVPGDRQVLVRVKAAGINISEAVIRTGAVAELFPSGQGSDLARVIEEVGAGVGGLYVAGTTAWGAVHAVEPKEGETIVISGAAGGVGSLAVQLARRTGATHRAGGRGVPWPGGWA